MTSTTPTRPAPSVHIACVASIEEGTLHGEWLEPSTFDSATDFENALHRMLSESPASEPEHWVVHETAGFGDLSLSKGFDLENIWNVARAIATSSAPDVVIEAVKAWPDDWPVVLEQHKGEFGPGQYARHLFRDLLEDSRLDTLEIFVDWRGYEDCLLRNGEIVILMVGGARHVFTM